MDMAIYLDGDILQLLSHLLNGTRCRTRCLLGSLLGLARCLLILGLLLNRGGILGELLGVRDEVGSTGQVLPQRLGYPQALLSSQQLKVSPIGEGKDLHPQSGSSREHSTMRG